MGLIIIISLIVFIFLILLIAIMNVSSSAPKASQEHIYQRNPNFLTKNEINFYRQLTKTEIAKKFIIFTKVRLIDIIIPDKNSKNIQASRCKIDKKHVDFVLCNTTSLQPVLVIELDDKTHDRPDRQARDIFVDGALKSAGIPILHTRTAEKIESKITEIISKKVKAKK